MKKLIYPILLLCIIIIALLLSSRMIFTGNFLFLYDQVREMILARDIVLNQKLTLIGTHSGVGGFFHGPLWLYMLIPVFLIGGGNPLAFAYTYTLLFLTIVVVGYFVGAYLYNKTFGLIVAFLLATSPRIWDTVKFTHGVHVIPLVYLMLFFFLIKFIRGDAKMFIFVSFFAGLTLQFETASAVLLIVLLPVLFSVQFIPLLLQNKKNRYSKVHALFSSLKQQYKIILLSVLSFCFSVSTFILFDLKHQFLMTNSLLQFSTSTEHEKGYLELYPRLMSHLHSLFETYFSYLFVHTSLLYFMVFAVCLMFLWLIYKKAIQSQYIIEWVFYLCFPLGLFSLYILYPYTIYPEYVLGLTIPSVFFFALMGERIWKNNIGKIIVLLFFGITLNYVYGTVSSLYGPLYTDNRSAGTYKSQQEVVDWIYQDAKGKPFGYFVYSPDTFTYGMDYLFWWNGKEKYNYIPKSEKIPTTYLIMYPGLSDDLSAHDFWKEHVIKTTVPVIQRKVFLGDIVVEKISPLATEEKEAAHYHQNLIFR